MSSTEHCHCTQRVIPLGRYKGKCLGSLSSGYLRWVAKQQGHGWSLWAQLAKQVLCERNALLEGSTNERVTTEQNLSLSKVINSLHASTKSFGLSTYASLLKWCGNAKALEHGRTVHDHILINDLHHCSNITALLVEMYGKCDALVDAECVFSTIMPKNKLAWNFMLKAYFEHGQGQELFKLFQVLLRKDVTPDRVAILYLLKECRDHTFLEVGNLVHQLVLDVFLESDCMIQNAIISMYGKFGSLEDALSMFHRMSNSDIVTWNTIITACSHNGFNKAALTMFSRMQHEAVITDYVTYVNIIDASKTLQEIQRLHVYITASNLESSIVVGTTLINTYGQCGSLNEAYRSFNKILQRNAICWTAMITAFAQNNKGVEALEMYTLMQKDGISPTKVTYVSVLDACAISGNLTLGELLHSQIRSKGFIYDSKLATALINMYGRCGKFEDAQKIFDSLPSRDTAAWNAMLATYSQHGILMCAFEVFEKMILQEVGLNTITYVSILSACSHAGLVDKAFNCFAKLYYDGILPMEHHYNCLVDLLARAGRLDEAELLVNIFSEPSFVSLMTLIAACKNQLDIKRGERVVKRLLGLGLIYEDVDILSSGIQAAHSVHKAEEFGEGKSHI